MSLSYVWRSMPFLRILWPFLVGLLLQDQWKIPLQMLWPFMILSIACTLCMRIMPIGIKYKWRYVHTALLHILLMTVGMHFYMQGEVHRHSQWFGKHWKEQDHMIIRLEAAFSEKEKTVQTIGAIEAIVRNKVYISVRGTILLYFHKSAYVQQLRYGDRLLLNSIPVALKNSGNPGTFAFADHYARQQIFHQVFIQRTHILRVERPRYTPWYLYLIRSRAWIVQQLQHTLSATAAGLAAAMLIGYKDGLDPSLYQTYVNTGVVHVIAISGMHLGLIYTILRMLTRWLPQKRGGRLMRGGLQLAGIWLFTLLTGAGPSILRAAVMFSCHILGQLKEKKSASLNNLSAAAFLLLCYRPQWLWDAGFLLSFSALAGIFLLQPPLYALYPSRPGWIDGLWKFNSVTLAAQLFTAPVSLYYFHQFPIYFLCSNMFAVPLSTAILLLGIALCMACAWPWMAGLLGKLTEVCILVLNRILEMIAGWPYALWDGWQLNSWQVAVCYVLIGTFYLHLRSAIRQLRWLALGCIALICAMDAALKYRARQQHVIIVYQLKKQTGVAWIEGRSSIFLLADELSGDTVTMQRSIIPTKTHFHIQRSVFQTWHGETCIFLQADKRICIAGKKAARILEQPLALLIITRYTPLDLLEMIDPKKVNQIVCDPTVSKEHQKRWGFYAQTHHIPYFSVYEQGAFVKTLP